MKKIFIVYGGQKSGKTTTIKKVFSEVKKNDDVSVENLCPGLRVEIFNIVSFKKIRIGFSSMGDVREAACRKIETLCQRDCDIIIGAVRGTEKSPMYTDMKEIAAKWNYEIEGISVRRTGEQADDFALAVKQDVVDRLLSIINELNR